MSKPRRCVKGGILAADGSCCPTGPHPAAEVEPEPAAEPEPSPPPRRQIEPDDEDERDVPWWQR